MLRLLGCLTVAQPAPFKRSLQLLQLPLTFSKQLRSSTAACPLLQALRLLALQRFLAFQLGV
ncbi:hypothetical protein D3C80_1979480 [compost metagenome]